MKNVIKKLCVFFIVMFACSSFAFTEDLLEPVQKIDLEEFDLNFLSEDGNGYISANTSKPKKRAQTTKSKNHESGKKKKSTRSKKATPRTHKRTDITNCWKPYWLMNRYFEPLKSYFFNMDVGCGFLYFAGARADLQWNDQRPTGIGISNRRDNGKIQGSLSYNRTPVFEAMLGTQLCEWVSLALSYVHQGGIYIQTDPQYYGPMLRPNNSFVDSTLYSFRSNLTLDAVLFKSYFNMPGSIIWKTLAYNMYLGLGVGPGWQSWSHNVSNRTALFFNGFILAESRFLKPKFSANAVWMVDLGFKLKSVLPSVPFSVRIGTKFIGWGQARQIGKVSQHRDFSIRETLAPFGLLRPFKVKFVYSFAPYMGVQWNF